MDDRVDLAEKLASFDAVFAPKIVGMLNDYKLQLVKVRGEFVWHSHPDTDDFFLVLSGQLTIQLRDRDVELSAGQLFVVPRGVEHCPRADEEAHVLLIEPIAKRLVTWWSRWADAFMRAGGRADEWRFHVDLPERQRQLGRAAGLVPRGLTARSLWM